LGKVGIFLRISFERQFSAEFVMKSNFTRTLFWKPISRRICIKINFPFIFRGKMPEKTTTV
jgi:hypothetical protein